MSSPEAEERPVIDSAQLARIEATHRGFLYQHLYAVSCLFILASLETGAVLVERDEDIEIETDDAVHFLQVKTRNRPLQPGDVNDALEHFETLRAQHKDRMNGRTMVFAIVANQPAGPKLTEEIKDWPEDVFYQGPHEDHPELSILPRPAPNLNNAIMSACALAESMPFQSLQSETLVWKLAARVQFAATGEDGARTNHRFDRADLSNLFEAFVDQLQEFPAIPPSYRPQNEEPELTSDHRLRLIVGFSGAGKTLWAASQARHTASPVGYFDIGDLPDTAVASSLAREIAARFLLSGPGDTARLPYGTGLEVLAALNTMLDAQDRPVMVLDNVQRCQPDVLRNIVNTCSAVHFVLLGQPGNYVAECETLLEIAHETLKGWTHETIANVFADHGVPVSPALARRVHHLTGGLPLYVESAAQIAAKAYASDARRFIEDIEAGEHTQPAAQEVILEKLLASLTPADQNLLAAVSLSRPPLDGAEIGRLTQTLPEAPANYTRCLRRMARLGLIQAYPNGHWKLHDAVSIPAQEYVEALGEEVRQNCLATLRDLLLVSLQERQDLVRMSAWARLLAPTGQANVLADISMEELFHEYGDPEDLKAVLESLVENGASKPDEEYWALEALAFWDLQSDTRFNDPMPRLLRMDDIIAEHPDIDADGPLRIGIKKMVWGGAAKDFSLIRENFDLCRSLAAQRPEKMLLVRYNYASALHVYGDNRRALPIAETLYMEYYDRLGLDVQDVLGANNQEMRALVGDVDDAKQTELKHLADCLSLAAKIKRAMGEHPRLLAIHAAKFYLLAGAWRSQMKVAQEFADDTLDLGDTQGAVMAMENYVLPLLEHFNFDGEYVEVNSHYSVLLAYDGRIEDARRQMARLEPFIPDLPPEYQQGIANQIRLIDELESGARSAPIRRGIPGTAPLQASTWDGPKVGRNAPCPCGSGKKFKKCCGRAM